MKEKFFFTLLVLLALSASTASGQGLPYGLVWEDPTGPGKAPLSLNAQFVAKDFWGKTDLLAAVERQNPYNGLAYRSDFQVFPASWRVLKQPLGARVGLNAFLPDPSFIRFENRLGQVRNAYEEVRLDLGAITDNMAGVRYRGFPRNRQIVGLYAGFLLSNPMDLSPYRRKFPYPDLVGANFYLTRNVFETKVGGQRVPWITLEVGAATEQTLRYRPKTHPADFQVTGAFDDLSADYYEDQVDVGANVPFWLLDRLLGWENTFNFMDMRVKLGHRRARQVHRIEESRLSLALAVNLTSRLSVYAQYRHRFGVKVRRTRRFVEDQPHRPSVDTQRFMVPTNEVGLWATYFSEKPNT